MQQEGMHSCSFDSSYKSNKSQTCAVMYRGQFSQSCTGSLMQTHNNSKRPVDDETHPREC